MKKKGFSIHIEIRGKNTRSLRKTIARTGSLVIQVASTAIVTHHTLIYM